ncbi:hypothetical protein ACFSKW_42950 [Nonomuraea mangrovi]|uniref:Uncharacterized protein n=1 Tax=Nonomuraea mangrovi TaxID=2316207 RepID=A0ABW4T8D8_9ACTN
MLPLRGLAAAVSDQLNVGGEQFPQPVDVAFPEGVEEPLGVTAADRNALADTGCVGEAS